MWYYFQGWSTGELACSTLELHVQQGNKITLNKITIKQIHHAPILYTQWISLLKKHETSNKKRKTTIDMTNDNLTKEIHVISKGDTFFNVHKKH